MGNVVGGDVAPNVVDGDQGDSQGIGHGLGKIHPHQHRADEAGGIGHRHGVNILPSQVRLGQGLVGQAGNHLDVFPGGQFRHHAAVYFVHLHRGGDAVGQDLPAVLHQGHCRLVAGGFHR